MTFKSFYLTEESSEYHNIFLMKNKSTGFDELIYEIDAKEVGKLTFSSPNNVVGSKEHINIEYIFVKPEYRNKGIGTKLVTYLKDLFRNKKITGSFNNDSIGIAKNLNLTEAPIVHDMYSKTPKDYSEKFIKNYKASKLVKTIGDIELRYNKRDDGVVENYVYKLIDETPIAVLSYIFLERKFEPFEKLPMIGWLYVDEKHRRGGIIKELHDFIMNYHNGFIMDVRLSKVSWDFYKKYCKKFNVFKFNNLNEKEMNTKIDIDDYVVKPNDRLVVVKKA
jgi:GNAT superfamily N-acetyltransferase